MRNVIITVSALVMSGCAILPANAQPAITSTPPTITADIKRLEEEQRRTGERVSDIRALIESDQLEGIYTLLGKIIETQRVQGDSIAAIDRQQGEFKATLASNLDVMTARIADAAQWKNTQTIGVAGSGVGISAIAGGVLLMRRRQGAPALPPATEDS